MMTSNTLSNLGDADKKQSVFVTATFTAEPLAETLNFWMDRLDFPLKVEFAPYSQVFQQLLDPESPIYRREPGVNIVLVRWEDWQHFEKPVAANALDRQEQLERQARELSQILQSTADRSTAPFLVCICPPSPAIASDTSWMNTYHKIEAQLTADIDSIGVIYLVTSSEVARSCPVTDYYDAYADEVGRIPYTTVFFTALATLLARKIHALRSLPRKVIVLDCDNTLWKGVCGEDGPLGIKIEAPYRALQEFMVEQHAAGRLLCLCSKNREQDVLDVFAQHGEMPLKLEHIISRRINWQSKSENLVSLAHELQLGLDSFIFLDDNPVECAEVQAGCPEVLALQLPAASDRIARFLQNSWPFDYLKITDTDRQRTTLYRQNRERELARQVAPTFEGFLAGLELRVEVSEMRAEHIERVAELTMRTNQFNMTTLRRTENDIRRLTQGGPLEFFVVDVQDRFGDYGLVGVVAVKPEGSALAIDTFLLSCRVLGRGVEHWVLGRIGNLALARHFDSVSIPFLPTRKNQPAYEFLNQIGANFRRPAEQGGYVYAIPLSWLQENLTPQVTPTNNIQDYQKESIK